MNWGFNNNANQGFNNFNQQNQGYQQNHLTQEEQQISNLLYQCTQSGAYPNLQQNSQLFLNIFRELKRESATFSGQKDGYSTQQQNYQSVSYCGTVCSHYKGKNYDIFSKILIPPGFPTQAPIFSVLNIDPTTFSVNQKFNRNILPDGTFEVKLDSAHQWGMQRNFTILLNEFKSLISINFPFFKSRNVTPPPPAPTYYPNPFGGHN